MDTLTRRDFLRILGAGAGAFAATCVLGSTSPAQAAAQASGKDTWGILIDLTRCTGCDSCSLACKEEYNLPNANIVPQALDNNTYTFIQAYQAANTKGEIVTRYVKRQCMHCLNAACVSACPAAAMYNSGEGPVVYRASRCLGCRYCEVGCPFGIPRFDWDEGVVPRINKCWLCFDRLARGRLPACVEACPTGALQFGRRGDLLAEAHGKIASNPGLYVNHVFGEFEVGGTSMLYLSDVPFENLGFPVGLPNTAPPEETEKIMVTLPYVIGGMTTLMTGTALYTHRKPSKSAGADEGATDSTDTPALAADEQEE